MPNPTSNLALPQILSAQAQKHVTHNDALRLLDGMVQIGVLSRVLAAPPGSPTEGDLYIVASGATGLWAGWDLNVAFWTDGAWLRLVPRRGWVAWSVADAGLYVWNGTSWTPIGGGISDGDKGDVVVSGGGSVWTLDPAANAVLNRLGLGGATPDATNRLSVNAPAALFNNAGTSFQMVLNKAAVANDALLVFQTGFSTRAIFGTGGSDDFTLKVSPNGSTFYDAMIADRNSGRVRFPVGVALDPLRLIPARPRTAGSGSTALPGRCATDWAASHAPWRMRISPGCHRSRATSCSPRPARAGRRPARLRAWPTSSTCSPSARAPT